MAKYLAKKTLWLSHECRMVPEGEVFETTFPEGMKLGATLELVKPEKAAKDAKAKAEAESGEGLV